MSNESHEKEYGRGYKDGKNANFLDQLSRTVNIIPNWSTEQDSYDKGFEDGVKDKGKK